MSSSCHPPAGPGPSSSNTRAAILTALLDLADDLADAIQWLAQSDR